VIAHRHFKQCTEISKINYCHLFANEAQEDQIEFETYWTLSIEENSVFQHKKHRLTAVITFTTIVIHSPQNNVHWQSRPSPLLSPRNVRRNLRFFFNSPSRFLQLLLWYLSSQKKNNRRIGHFNIDADMYRLIDRFCPPSSLSPPPPLQGGGGEEGRGMTA